MALGAHRKYQACNHEGTESRLRQAAIRRRHEAHISLIIIIIIIPNVLHPQRVPEVRLVQAVNPAATQVSHAHAVAISDKKRVVFFQRRPVRVQNAAEHLGETFRAKAYDVRLCWKQ